MAEEPEKERNIDTEAIYRLTALLKELGLSEIEYGEADWHVRVAKSAAVMTSATTQSTPQTTTESSQNAEESSAIANHPGVVISPMVGVVYTSDEPDSPPLIKVGDMVKDGDPLLLIEAMKVFNQIKASRSGKVVRILVSNGMPVEFGEPLLIIE